MQVQLASMRDAYAETLLRLGKDNPHIVVLGADTAVSIKTSSFGEHFPNRFFNVGIAEQNLIGVAAGLALAGKVVFVSTYSAFVPGKCLDQIRNAVAYPNLAVKIISSHGGITVGPDGASHQTVEDLAAMRAVPRMKVVVPADARSTARLIRKAAEVPGPFYVRLARPNVPFVYDEESNVEVGKCITVRDGTDLSVVACGVMVYEAVQAAEELEKFGVSARVLDCHTLKPIDTEALEKAARETGGIVTAEEHNVLGGLGGAVAETVSESYPVPIMRVGVQDTFGESGEHVELMMKYGLTSKDIVKASRMLLEERRR